ncbi:hypothetical protein DRO54_10765 [Candidatus Bathyarchaeota archaeon]|nr:MAG: hypothetical protein DRO54_10765 [Candidatus Bathyarchaeota archaeon]
MKKKQEKEKQENQEQEEKLIISKKLSVRHHDGGERHNVEVTVDFSSLSKEDLANWAFKSIWISKQNNLRRLDEKTFNARVSGGKISIKATPMQERSSSRFDWDSLTYEEKITFAAEKMGIDPEVAKTLIKK